MYCVGAPELSKLALRLQRSLRARIGFPQQGIEVVVGGAQPDVHVVPGRPRRGQRREVVVGVQQQVRTDRHVSCRTRTILAVVPRAPRHATLAKTSAVPARERFQAAIA